MTTAPGWPVVEVPALDLAVGVPPGWEWSETDGFPLQMLGPSAGGHRPSLCLSAQRFDPPTPQGCQRWLEAALSERAVGYPGFHELRRGTLLVAGHPAVASHHRWVPTAVGVEVDQLLVAIVHGPGWIVQVDAAALAVGTDTLATARRIVTTLELDEVAVSGA